MQVSNKKPKQVLSFLPNPERTFLDPGVRGLWPGAGGAGLAKQTPTQTPNPACRPTEAKALQALKPKPRERRPPATSARLHRHPSQHQRRPRPGIPNFGAFTKQGSKSLGREDYGLAGFAFRISLI